MKNIFLLIVGLFLIASSASAELYSKAELEELDKDTLIEIVLDLQKSKRHQKRVRAFCNGDDDLVTLRGDVIATYSWTHQCQASLEQLKDYNAVCDGDDNLISSNGATIAEYSWTHQCTASLEQFKQYDAICDGDDNLINRHGEVIAEYSWTHQCEAALKAL